MLNLKSYTDFAGELIKFVDRIKTYDVSFEDMVKLDEIIPLKEDLDIISSWWNGTMKAETTTTTTSTTAIASTTATTTTSTNTSTTTEPSKIKTKTDNPKKKKPRKLHRLTNDRAKAISEYIALKHDGDKTMNVITDVTKEFKEHQSSIQRIIDKVSFKEITDQYFNVKDGVIISKFTAKNIFGSSKSDVDLIRELIKDAKYNVIAVITDDMTASDITKLAMVRLKMYQTGEVDSIGGGVKEILIMNEISNNKKSNINSIMNIMKNKYNVTVDPELVSAVKTGRSHKEIFSRF